MCIINENVESLLSVASKVNNQLSKECLELLSYLLLKAKKNGKDILELPDDAIETPIHISDEATKKTFLIVTGKEPDIKTTKVFKYCFFSM